MHWCHSYRLHKHWRTATVVAAAETVPGTVHIISPKYLNFGDIIIDKRRKTIIFGILTLYFSYINLIVYTFKKNVVLGNIKLYLANSVLFINNHTIGMGNMTSLILNMSSIKWK